MAELQQLLTRCFAAIFPQLNEQEIQGATLINVEAWDSLASVQLFAVVEEEFLIDIQVEDLEYLDSFASILEYLRAKIDD